jgi:predicted O-linked N-acetylglucosamine transferase (SPINDLY family)
MPSKSDAPSDPSTSRFSVIWPSGGGPRSVAPCISSLEAQTCADFELVLHDDDSSDSVAEVVREARQRNWRLRLVPGGAGSKGERLLDLLRNCSGDYIAFLPSEGRFRPQTFDLVMRQFRLTPGIGGICAKGFLVDPRGKAPQCVDIVTLLLTTYRPFMPAGFIDRGALVATGLQREGWFEAALDLDLWSRLAIDHGIRQLDEDVLVDVSGAPWDWLDGDAKAALADRIGVVARIFSSEGFFGSDPALAAESKANQAAILWEHFRALGVDEIEYLVTTPLSAAVREFQPPSGPESRHLRSLHRLLCARSQNLGILSGPIQWLLAAAMRTNGPLAKRAARALWSLPFFGYRLKRKMILLTTPTADFHRLAPTREEMFADLYAHVAELYAARGQTDLALAAWERAQPPADETSDSRANQEMLRLPGATDASIADHQKRWVSRHVSHSAAVAPASVKTSTSGRKIRIGYHCSFMNSDTIRYQMRDVLKAHDRSAFEIHGYYAGPVVEDIRSAFDVMHDTSNAIDSEVFAALVRSQEMDVFVELTGFSPGHRFAAMAHRCAPVQVSYLNHTGSSHVPNVDYILADEISIPTGSPDEAHYSEQIWRLPNCFFCFDYRNSHPPDIVAPPSTYRPFVTFGCFGSGSKLNRPLLELWARLLHAVPDSRLWLQNAQLGSQSNRRLIASRFEHQGIDCRRLILRRGAPRDQLQHAFSQIDVSLDTWPYCGGNTVAESFWMGVPVVTLTGDRFGTRYGASLVTAAGCPDLVAQTPEQYIEIAAALAADLPRRQKLRPALRQMSIDHGLGDSTAFARTLENAYREMLDRVG